MLLDDRVNHARTTRTTGVIDQHDGQLHVHQLLHERGQVPLVIVDGNDNDCAEHQLRGKKDAPA